MNRDIFLKTRGVHLGIVLLLLALACMLRSFGMTAYAEESDAYTGADSGLMTVILSDESGAGINESDDISAEATEEDPGTYSMEDGWSEDYTQSTVDVKAFRQDTYADAAETSVIYCSYLDTNYSRQEYEQLREMLTNNLLYSNVNAQISTSAVYTLAKDYLYIILVDDSLQEYRDIYYYVVGDYECFCVQVKEYRAEAELAQSEDTETPQEIGQKVAEGFVWDTDD
ncbi:MAG: hypothetical protein LUH07_10325 [Lachnospiraceae bacterium]|nr:hypothetical protein [Lachnospiraceae bacterium]